MNILLLVLSYPIGRQRNIYRDLAEELRRRGNNVYVASSGEGRNDIDCKFLNESGINILKIRTLKMQKNNKISKGIATLLISNKFKRYIKKYYGKIDFDLILYSTPPITFYDVVYYIKKRNKCASYLMLKDIFPQNAVDLGMINEKSVIYRLFRKVEIKLYKISDYIGCMSTENKKYLISKNKYIDKKKVEICANSMAASNNINEKKLDESLLKKNLNIEKGAMTFIYGGNLGPAQGIDFLMEVLNFYKNNKKFHFIIIGDGTEYKRINRCIKEEKIENVTIKNFIPKEEFDQYLKISDIGLIFLDKRFTIPNFPSRILSYMEFKLPIIAATDKNTDIRECIRASACGEWCENGNIKEFNKIVNKFYYDKSLLNQCGKNSRSCLERNFNVKKSVDEILKHF